MYPPSPVWRPDPLPVTWVHDPGLDWWIPCVRRDHDHPATAEITVGATTGNPERVRVQVRDRDVSDAAMDASWDRIR